MPAETPVARPELMSIVATAVLLLVQSPPVTVLLNVVVAASHTVVVPDIVPASGNAQMITTPSPLLYPLVCVTPDASVASV